MLSGIRLRRGPRRRRARRPLWGVEGVVPGGCHRGVEKLRAGLISGGSTPILCAADKLGEAPFKDFWSDDTKNNYREEMPGKTSQGQTRPGTARGVRPRRRAAGGDEAVLGARL